jgi:nucleoside-diphosphate-sugar epimerase
MRWCILRGGRFVGPGTFEENTVADLRNGTRIITGTGQNFVSLIHVGDMATATLAALLHAPHRSIFNVVDEPMREGDYLDQLADAIGVGRPPRNTALPTPPSWRCSNQAARSDLDWSPTHPLIP